MMRNLEIERLAAAAMSLGSIRSCLQIMINYGKESEKFKGSEGYYDEGLLQREIAISYAEYMAGRTYVYNIARKLDLATYGNGLEADSAKLFVAPIAKREADRAMQV